MEEMPVVSRFYGILIKMYFNEEGHHEPHFHAEYGDNNASIAISSLKILEGKLPRRAMSLVLEWAFQHREELFENWNLAKQGEPLNRISPLK